MEMEMEIIEKGIETEREKTEIEIEIEGEFKGEE